MNVHASILFMHMWTTMNVHSSCSRCPFVDSSTLGADYFYLKCGTDTVSCTCLRKTNFILSTCSKCSRRIEVTSGLGQRTFLVVFAEQFFSSCQRVASVQATFKSHRSFCRAVFFSSCQHVASVQATIEFI